MKNIILVIALFVAAKTVAQSNLAPTDTLQISGKIKKQLSLTLSAFDTLKKTSIGDLTMLDRNGDVKETNKNVKGILLKDLFQNIDFQSQNQKSLLTFYLVLSATDGFKLVLSWNEVFHAKSCTNFYLITDKDGKKISELKDRLMIVEINDKKMGHKRIESLDKIVVKQVE